jgi:hypothetical protein
MVLIERHGRTIRCRARDAFATFHERRSQVDAPKPELQAGCKDNVALQLTHWQLLGKDELTLQGAIVL